MIGSLLIVLIMVSSSQLASAQTKLTLKAAMRRALKTHSSVKNSRSTHQQAIYSKRQIYGELMPSLFASKTFKKEPRWSGTKIRGREHVDWQESGAIGFQVDLPNPYIYYNRLRLADENKKNTLSSMEQTRQGLIDDLRQSYFAVKIAERQIAVLEQNISLAKQAENFTVARHDKGFSREVDVTRSRLIRQQLEATLAGFEEQKRNEMANLCALVGLKRTKTFALVDDLPQSFKFFSLPEGSLEKELVRSRSEQIKQAKTSIEIANLNSKNAVAALFPTINFKAAWTRNYIVNNYDPIPPFVPTYTITARWDILTGGESYYDFRKKSEQKEIAAQSYRQLRLDNSVAILRGVKQLGLLKRQYQLQEQRMKNIEQIVSDSKRRYQNGVVDAKQVNDDFRILLGEQQTLFNISFSIVQVASQLSKDYGDPSLFERLL